MVVDCDRLDMIILSRNTVRSFVGGMMFSMVGESGGTPSIGGWGEAMSQFEDHPFAAYLIS